MKELIREFAIGFCVVGAAIMAIGAFVALELWASLVFIGAALAYVGIAVLVNRLEV